MMSKSLLDGLKATLRLKRLVIIFYLANLFAALIVMFPLRSMLGDFAGYTLMGRSLAGGLSTDFLFEFFTNNSGGVKFLGGLIGIVSVLYWIAALFLSGGAFSVYISGERFSVGMFWSNSAKYFGRFARLWLFSIPVFFIVYCFQFIVPLFVRLMYGSDPYQYVTFWAGVIRVGLGYLGIVFYYMVLDYARIYVVRYDEHSMFRVLLKSISFCFKNFFRTFSLALLLFIVSIVSLILYRWVSGFLSGSSAGIIFLLIMFEQLYIMFRSFMKLTLFAGQVELFRNIIPPEPVLQPSEPENPGLEGTSHEIGITA